MLGRRNPDACLQRRRRTEDWRGASGMRIVVAMPNPNRRREPGQDRDTLEEVEDSEDTATVEAVIAVATGEPRGVPPVTALNPAAGAHHITTDPRELRSALRAGRRTQRRFRYYEQRYGQRGMAFTHSDSAWIVTVAQQPPPVVERQLRWLGAVLAARGMPRWLLETHLETLHAELASAVPEKRAAYDALLGVAEILRRERFSRLDPATSSHLAEAFEDRVGPVSAQVLPEAGALLVAAVADELNGLPRAVESLMEWLADPARFPDDWVAAATDTIAAARERAEE